MYNWSLKGVKSLLVLWEHHIHYGVCTRKVGTPHTLWCMYQKS